jgi:hypothetical protein
LRLRTLRISEGLNFEHLPFSFPKQRSDGPRGFHRSDNAMTHFDTCILDAFQAGPPPGKGNYCIAPGAHSIPFLSP